MGTFKNDVRILIFFFLSTTHVFSHISFPLEMKFLKRWFTSMNFKGILLVITTQLNSVQWTHSEKTVVRYIVFHNNYFGDTGQDK